MMRSQSSYSSGSGDDPRVAEEYERKRKRMLSNRESARRSRMKKQQHLDDLVNQMAVLKSENRQILIQIEALTHQCLGLDADNAVLRARAAELLERLQSLNSVLQFMEERSGEFGGVPLLEPWQPSSSSCFLPPIMAAAAIHPALWS